MYRPKKANIKIIISDKTSKNNKQLLMNFLTDNMVDKINRSSNVIDIEIVDKNNITFYKNKGITNLPAIEFFDGRNTVIISGVPDIQSFFHRECSKKKRTEPMDDEEMMRNYLVRMAKANDDDDDDGEYDEDGRGKLDPNTEQKFRSEVERRKNIGSKNKKVSFFSSNNDDDDDEKYMSRNTNNQRQQQPPQQLPPPQQQINRNDNIDGPSMDDLVRDADDPDDRLILNMLNNNY